MCLWYHKLLYGNLNNDAQDLLVAVLGNTDIGPNKHLPFEGCSLFNRNRQSLAQVKGLESHLTLLGRHMLALRRKQHQLQKWQTQASPWYYGNTDHLSHRGRGRTFRDEGPLPLPLPPHILHTWCASRFDGTVESLLEHLVSPSLSPHSFGTTIFL